MNSWRGRNVIISKVVKSKVIISIVVVLSVRVKAGNTNRRGRLSTVDLLTKVACFVKKQIMLAISKAAGLN